jgi:rod shape-determining protein MreC
MQNLIRFFRMYNVLIIFLLLQTYSINLYLNNNSFQNSLFINHVNNYKGELYSISNNISEYFNLKDINKQLLEENNKLYNLLSSQKSIFLQNEKETKFISGKIVNNSVNKRDNFITLNKGKKTWCECWNGSYL